MMTNGHVQYIHASYKSLTKPVIEQKPVGKYCIPNGELLLIMILQGSERSHVAVGHYAIEIIRSNGSLDLPCRL